MGLPLADVASEATRASEMVGTMGVALSVCTLPGQVPSDRVGPGKMELGLGIVSYVSLEKHSTILVLLFHTEIADIDFCSSCLQLIISLNTELIAFSIGLSFSGTFHQCPLLFPLFMEFFNLHINIYSLF